jgi:hypothetical protein
VKIKIFTAADYVDATSGKLTIVGAFDNIESPKCPFIFKPFGIAIKILCEPRYAGRFYKGAIVLRGPIMIRPVASIPIGINFPKKPEKKIQSVTLTVNVVGAEFKTFGEYILEFKLKNKIIDAIKLRVVHKNLPDISIKPEKRKLLK